MDNNQKRKSLKSVLLYVTVIVVSALLLIIGNRIATTNLDLFSEEFAQDVLKAKVLEIESRDVNSYSLDETVSIESIDITFRAKVLNGYLKDEVISATNRSMASLQRMQLRLKSVTRSCWYLLTR